MNVGKRFRRTIRRLKSHEPDWVRITDSPAQEVPSTQPRIPRQLFQTGPSALLHPKHFEAIVNLRARNSQLSHYFLDDQRADEYMADQWGDRPIYSVYQRSLIPQMRADIFRYCIVFDRGGYYLDINKSVAEPLESFHDASHDGLISFERNPATIFPPPEAASHLAHPRNVVLQWAFGFSPRHPVLADTIALIEQASPYFQGDMDSVSQAVVMFTGPGAFTSAVRNFVAAQGSESIAQAGVDFHGGGTLRVPGSNLMPQTGTHYTQLEAGPILG